MPSQTPGLADLVDRGLLVALKSVRSDTLYRLDKALLPAIDYVELQQSTDLQFELEKQHQKAAERMESALPRGIICAGPPAANRRGDVWGASGLPWPLKADVPTVDWVTRGKPLIMDRATWDALPVRPPVDGFAVVVERNDEAADRLLADGAFVAETLQAALQMAREQIVGLPNQEIHIVGGPALFKQAIKLADRLHLTGDSPTWTPQLPGWKERPYDQAPPSRSAPDVRHVVLERQRRHRGRLETDHHAG